MQLDEKLAEVIGLSPGAECPLSEKALIELIRLQREKEITKQQYYRLEILGRSTELLNKCLHVNMPPNLIPTVFSGEAPAEVQQEQQRQAQARAQVQAHQQHIQLSPHPLAHQPPPQIQQLQSPQGQAYQQFPQPLQQQQQQQQQQHNIYMVPQRQQQLQQQQQQQTQYATHLGPPVKFQRPHSPAKIGAAAVAQLERSRFPPSPIHKRTLSTPITFGPQLTKTPIPQISVTSSPTAPRPAAPQQSMMRTMSSIQFINENPGRKRRRTSDTSKENVDEEGEATEEEEEEGTDEPKSAPPVGRKIRHVRARSDNFVFDKKTTNHSTINHQSSKPTVKEMAKRIEEKNSAEEPKKGFNVEPEKKPKTPSSGPNFANDILSSA
ncbi:Bop3p CYBJADRAFT_89253 [Cyberlindnera jadinii NRRL Y-1542]|uniref:Uncharacterized protein n=1 Tax=Cyberlindnera jadinii (strain ATCC 18201 / CBS 1600 / BCRC 20928 / JCM 3617 / NBRC 0987 / NRRL Y-1542) TaxID=983966 RepID=A0A1E4S2I6_CYBJN|nr:hypothetical protein CYBJADRAFT_89253 [Cyberlindnera jadinii NRRL Y-1542]ODV73736.1 hypothetical protein CYBJADRAFT_89253 [Cyberlindnera jadinii NRRL Y-1542]